MNSVKNIKYEILQLPKRFLALTLAVVLASSSFAGCTIFFTSSEEGMSDEDKKFIEDAVLRTKSDRYKDYFQFDEKKYTVDNKEKASEINNYANKLESTLKKIENNQDCFDNSVNKKKEIPKYDNREKMGQFIKDLEAAIAACGSIDTKVDDFLSNINDQNLNAVISAVGNATDDAKNNAKKAIYDEIQVIAKRLDSKVRSRTWKSFGLKDTYEKLFVKSLLGKGHEIYNPIDFAITKKGYEFKDMYEHALSNSNPKSIVANMLSSLFGRNLSWTKLLTIGIFGEGNIQGLFGSDGDVEKLEDDSSPAKTIIDYRQDNENGVTANKESVERLINLILNATFILNNDTETLKELGLHDPKDVLTKLGEVKTKLESIKIKSDKDIKINREASQIIGDLGGKPWTSNATSISSKSNVDIRIDVDKAYKMVRAFQVLAGNTDPGEVKTEK